MFAALGRACHRHRRAVLAAWLAVAVLGVVFGGQLFGRLTDTAGAGGLESVRAAHQLTAASTSGARLLGLVDGVPVDTPGTRAAITAAADDLKTVPDVLQVADPYRSHQPQLRATDGRAALVVVTLRKGLGSKAVATIADRTRAELARVPGARVAVGGDAVRQQETNAVVSSDLHRGEMVSLPLAAIVLVIVFGGVLVAGLPLAAALASIAGALVALLGFSAVMSISADVVSVVTVLGLALAVDYGLLMVNRFREERAISAREERATSADAAAAERATATAVERATATAVERTTATAGRTVAFSALTVTVSLAGLFAFDDPTYRSMAAAGISVVLVALAVGITLVPALLSVAAGRIRTPESTTGLRRFAAPPPDDGFFSRLTTRVARHPVPVIVVLAAALLAAAVPFLGVQFKNGGAEVLPRSFASRQVADAVATRFPGHRVDPIQVVGRVSARDPRVTSYAAALRRLPHVASVEVSPVGTGGVSVVNVYPTGTSQGPQAKALVHTLRSSRPAYASLVTGQAAFLVDFQHQIAAGLPWALGFVALATGLLLFLMTGSVLIPLKALVMNVLSLGASFGALAWVFQDGHGAGLLDLPSTGALETWVPVIVFVFAFGLSMDYEVFLLSRIKELHDAGLPNDRAVALGLQRSGRIITSAALLVVVVFAGFASGQMLGIKEMGLALTVAVLIDATLVRCLLVPATMSLLGEWNWWAPRWLRRVHARLGLSEGPAGVVAVPAPRAPEPSGVRRP